MAEGEGFEPPQTESESGVLPLHKPSKLYARLGTCLLYTGQWKSQALFSISPEIFFPGNGLLCIRLFFPGEGLPLQHVPAQIAEGLFLPPVAEHGQDIVKLSSGLFMHQRLLSAAGEILQRGAVGIVFPLIGLAGGDAVHHHLRQIFPRHGEGFILPGVHIHIRPVFVVVAVAALMMHPCLAEALVLPLGGIGAAVALIVFCPDGEFRGRIFGKIMGQPLPVKPHLKAASHYQNTMVGYGLEMLPSFHQNSLLRSLIIAVIIPCPSQNCKAGKRIVPPALTR